MKKYLFIAFSLFSLSACHESIEERAAREAEEFTRKNCPMPLAENVMLDSMTYEKPTRTLHYFYTISGNINAAAVNSSDVREKLLEGVKNDTSTRKYKEEGFNFAYTYFSGSQKGTVLTDVRFTPKDYNEAK